LLVEVPFDHWEGGRWMKTDLLGGEVGPGGEVAAVDGGAPGGEGRREEGGVVEGDATSDGGVGGEKGVDAMLGLMVGEKDGRGWWGLELGQVDGPEVGGWRAVADEDGGAVEGDVDGVRVEGGGATVVAEESDGEERARGKGRKDVSDAGAGRKVR
jgi:hypothetical protein